MQRNQFSIATLVLVLTNLPVEANLRVEQPCTKSERWQLTASLDPESDAQLKRAFDRLSLARSGRIPAISLFAEAEALRKLGIEDAQSNDVALHLFASSLNLGGAPFAAYPIWIALALEGQTKTVKSAALACLTRLRVKHPTLRLNDQLALGAADLIASLDDDSQTLIATMILRDFPRMKDASAKPLLAKVSDPVLLAAIALLRQSAAGQPLSENSAKMIEPLLATGAIPNALKPVREILTVILAQNHFSSKRFEDALRVFRLVPTRSNLLPEALTGISWSALKVATPGSVRGYDRAVGAGLSVRQGNLKNTFIPEPMLVTAIALQELCLFPEAMQAMEGFRRSYQGTFEWLNSNIQSLTPPQAYQLTIGFLSGKDTTLPARVGTEWIRHPKFLGTQNDINALLDESAALKQWVSHAQIEQKELAGSLVKRWGSLKQKLREIRAQANQREEAVQIPLSIRKDLDSLREDLIDYRRLKASAPAFERLSELRAKVRSNEIAQRRQSIGQALVARAQQMKRELDGIADTLQLVEIEIFQGASQDIVWREANPEFQKHEKRLGTEGSSEAASKTWNWGAQKASLTEEGGEVWEDEIGAFQARLSDQCSAKDRYAQLRKVAQK